jgi:hypothetical protein
MNDRELCETLKQMIENSLQTASMNLLPDTIHKMGLVGTMEDMLRLINEHEKEDKNFTPPYPTT